MFNTSVLMGHWGRLYPERSSLGFNQISGLRPKFEDVGCVESAVAVNKISSLRLEFEGFCGLLIGPLAPRIRRLTEANLLRDRLSQC